LDDNWTLRQGERGALSKTAHVLNLEVLRSPFNLVEESASNWGDWQVFHASWIYCA